MKTSKPIEEQGFHIIYPIPGINRGNTGTSTAPAGIHQIIQGDEDGGSVRYYAEMPVKDKTTEEWLKGNAAYLAWTKLAGEA